MLLRTSLPGIEAKDLRLEIEGKVLTLSGSFAEEPEAATSIARHVERRRGSFTRTLHLPFEVRADGVEARLERGVLEVTIPRFPKDPAVRIQVRSEATTN